MKVSLKTITFIVASSLIYIIVYVLLNSQDTSMLVVPNDITPESFQALIYGKATTVKQQEVVTYSFESDPNSGAYSVKLNLTPAEHLELRKVLAEIGYYTDLSSTDRDVETTPKKILNGIFGQFFRFKLLGPLNWLAIPIISYILLNFKRQNRIWWGLTIFYLIATVFVIKGGYNYRYQLSLLPITLILVVYGIDQYLFTTGKKLDTYIIYIFIILVTCINFFLSYLSLGDASKKYTQIIAPKESKESNARTSKKLGYFMDMQAYINSMDTDKVFMINNLPEFYYYTNKAGVYCWFSDNLCWGDRTLELFDKRSGVELSDYLREKYNVKYILSTTTFNKYNSAISIYINKFTKVLYQDGEVILYEIE